MSEENKELQFKEFVKAIEDGDKDKVKDLIAQGVNINRQIAIDSPLGDKMYMTPLILSIQNGQYIEDDTKDNRGITQILLDSGATVNANSLENVFTRNTALNEAVNQGNLKLVEQLVDKGAKLNVRSFGSTPLHSVLYKIKDEEKKRKKKDEKKLEEYVNIAKLLVNKGANINMKSNVSMFRKKNMSAIEIAEELQDRSIFNLMMEKQNKKETNMSEISKKYIEKYGGEFSEKAINTYLSLKNRNENVEIKNLDPEDLDNLLRLSEHIKQESILSNKNNVTEITADDLKELEEKAPIYIRGISSATGAETNFESTPMKKKHNEAGIGLEIRKLVREYESETLTNISSKKEGNLNRCVTMINYGKVQPFRDVGYGIIKGNVSEMKQKNLKDNITQNMKDIHLAGHHDLYSTPNKEEDILTVTSKNVDIDNLPIDKSLISVFEGLKEIKGVESHNEVIMDVQEKDVKFIFWSEYRSDPSFSKLKAVYFQKKFMEQTGRKLPIIFYNPGDKEYMKESNFSKEEVVNLLREQIITNDGKDLKAEYKSGRAADFLLTFKDEILEIPEMNDNGIIEKFVKDKISEYSDKNNINDIYDVVNFIKFVGATEGKTRQQEAFEEIFKNLNLGEIAVNFEEMIKSNTKRDNNSIFIVEMMSEIRALATNEHTLGIIKPKLEEVSKYIENVELMKNAISKDDDELLEELIKKGVDLNMDMGKGKNPLHYLLEVNNKSEKTANLLKLMIENKIDINIVDKSGKTPLQYAVEKNNEEIVRVLLENNANPNPNILNKYDKTPLQCAVEKSNYDIVELLLENNADPNMTANLGETPLKEATYRGTEEMVALLLQYGADPNIEDKDHRTPLIYAIMNRNEEKVMDLINSNAEVNRTDIYGRTPLMYAAGIVDNDIVKLLLEHGANPDIADKDGKTALEYAISGNNKDTQQILEDASVKFRKNNNNNKNLHSLENIRSKLKEVDEIIETTEVLEKGKIENKPGEKNIQDENKEIEEKVSVKDKTMKFEELAKKNNKSKDSFSI